MLLSDNWTDYTLIDASDGEKLEKWGDYYLVRPDPQAIWSKRSEKTLWNKAHARYNRSKAGGGWWDYNQKLPDSWQIKYRDLTFNVKPMGFKHTGIFPEQAANWDFIIEKITQANRPVKVLNLFAYTGGATVASAFAGASVVHVDAAKGMVAWAKENAASSGLSDAPIRYIVDDCVKFVEREKRRGNKYDVILMDPPTYGRGPKGELWRFEDELFGLVTKCVEILSDNPVLFIVNSYTTGISHTVVSNVLSYLIKDKFGGEIQSDELGLKMTSNGLALPCGYTTRWFEK
ncbi:MAG: class I SAM-dependent methyltransferase [Clostridia bacterium]|nr:class I SAM-dependent methyltransferase [Clostridia bacterium]